MIMDAIIKISDIRKSYYIGRHALEVLKGVSLDIFKNDYVSLMGPSGSGKFWVAWIRLPVASISLMERM